jgi:hypothetical protein
MAQQGPGFLRRTDQNMWNNSATLVAYSTLMATSFPKRRD